MGGRLHALTPIADVTENRRLVRADSRPGAFGAEGIRDATHGDAASGDVRSGRLAPWRTAAECLDFTCPCPSIFLDRAAARARGVNRPLAEATMARIARGVKRFVLDADEPFVVPGGDVGAGAKAERVAGFVPDARGALREPEEAA